VSMRRGGTLRNCRLVCRRRGFRRLIAVAWEVDEP
jgi:hypothetical protein